MSHCLQPEHPQRALAAEVRALGGVWLLCDEGGTIVDAERAAIDDPIGSLLLQSLTFHQLLRRVTPELLQSAKRIGEVLPGLFVIASVLSCPPGAQGGHGPRRIGMAIVPTAAFAHSAELLRLAASAGLDGHTLRATILAGNPLEAREIARLAPLICLAHRADADRVSECETGEAVGRQLAETYEEINLLYTLVSGMAVTEAPGPFLTLACTELVGTLGFSWVAVRLRAPFDRFAPPEGLIVVGEPAMDRERLTELSTRLLLATGAKSPRVYPRGHHVLTEMQIDEPVIACPIRREGRSNGVLLLGARRHRGGEVGSADLRLADATAGHLGLYLENASLYRDVDAMFLGTLDAIVTAIDAKDPYTRGHSQRVAALARELARSIGVEEPTLRQIHIAGLVHDVGKIGVVETVLRKPGRLDDQEFAQIRAHPEIGWRILKDIPQFRDMLDGVLSHHERWDGRGYPYGRTGRDIPLIARVIALADSFDAMSSNRTYRTRRPRAQVLAELRQCSGTQFDPDLVEPFVAMDFAEYDRLHEEHERQASLVTGAAA
ncbi:MAG: HD domain-containing protein [Phycisphaerae bacterium]|nr:HD domain-containing protein [Phycisphaerae bacterium]